MCNAHIVIVEDDDLLRESLLNFYTKNKFLTKAFDSTLGVYQYIQSYIDTPNDKVQIIVCDIMLPGENGFSLMEQLKDFPELGKIFISTKTDIENRIKGLSLGADDYICKPVDSTELLLRTQSSLARLNTVKEDEVSDNIKFLNFELNPETRILSSNNKSLELSGAEHQLLILLISKQGKICSRQEIAQALNAPEKSTQGRALDILLSRLRKKMSSLNAKDNIITYRGKGYLLILN